VFDDINLIQIILIFKHQIKNIWIFRRMSLSRQMKLLLQYGTDEEVCRMPRCSNIVELQSDAEPGETERIKCWHMRHAMQLAVQLPEDQGDMRLVIMCLEELAEKFLCRSGKETANRV
jgi:hypothetical protein